MHIPDGFLATPVWAAAGAVSVPGVAYCARRAHAVLEEGRIPLMGVMGAFVFAAQMINFPVGVGTSGHLVGGALLAMTLGPASACLVMTAILTVQALLFQDGGVLALGANVLNMALAGVFAGYLPFQLWGGGSRRKLAIWLGGFFSVFVSASLAMTELLLSGIPIPTGVALLSLVLFAISGAMEGAITVAALDALGRLNPSWVRTSQTAGKGGYGALWVGAVLLACVGILIASPLPDGLEKLAESLGIAGRASNLFKSPLSDYEASFVSAAWLRKALAGLAGLLATYLVCLAAGRMIAKRGSKA
ncbi:MAG: energy-coupling factor ABC transporter permease [Candidatus Solibacter usitatus]|nr:energy-coupling factor ABC transporter permease [Candidatus Solibacter usitatus]